MTVGTTINGRGKLHIWSSWPEHPLWATSLCGLSSVPQVFGSADDPDLCTRCRQARTRQLAPVSDWSLRIHGNSGRHAWCLAAATAVLDGTEVPPWPGGRKATGVTRLETIRRLLKVSA